MSCPFLIIIEMADNHIQFILNGQVVSRSCYGVIANSMTEHKKLKGVTYRSAFMQEVCYLHILDDCRYEKR